MNPQKLLKFLWVGLCAFLPQSVWAGSLTEHVDPINAIILWGALLLFFGLVGRYIAKYFDQPGVLGELLMGVLVGNICYGCGMQLMLLLRDSGTVFVVIQNMLQGVSLVDAVHANIPNSADAKKMLAALSNVNGNQWITTTIVIDAFSRYGVMFLLFMVGLESSLSDLKKTGKESARVAIIGVVAPIALGLLVIAFMLPNASFSTSLFVAATLSATSVGITARVLQDMKKLHTREAKTILGAAMIDDVLGLIILALVSAMAMGGTVNMWMITHISCMAILFFPLSLWVGPIALRHMIAWGTALDPLDAKLLVSFIFVMIFSWLATLVHMAAIIGAFVAGLILHEGFFKSHEQVSTAPQSIKQLLSPFEAIFAPLFFMLIGIQVKVESFLDIHVVVCAIGLIVAAVLGKLLSGFGGNRQDNRVLIGIGMVPRGEVGLVFASVGKGLGVIPDSLFSAIILMVAVTTFITPVWMKFQYTRGKHRITT
ncbi:MAG: sodium:proton antiporter [Legionella sp.]|nr:MAG: sodium:proton antiporter [Legionella sp.]